MAIPQGIRGKLKRLGAAGKPINGRIVRRARLPRGVKEVKNPRQAWRLR